MEIDINKHIQKAKRTLIGSWLGNYTKLSDLYPHQWGWDAAFMGLGWSTFAPQKAKTEIKTQLAHQWPNGMVPQIIFHAGEALNYYPGPNRWQAHHYSGQDGPPTSGCIQPPMQAVAVLRIYQQLDYEEGRQFLTWAYPRLLQWHRYLYRERCPDDDGLVYVRHPWETGLDNLPDWDKPLERIDLSTQALPSYQREDNKHITDKHRPDHIYYDRYTRLVDLFYHNNYDEEKIRKECPFIVEDPAFNAMLCEANTALVTIANIVNRTAYEPRQWLKQTRQAMNNKLYSAEDKRFYAYDRKNSDLLDSHESLVGYIPLYGGVVDNEQAESMVKRMKEKEYFSDQRYALATTSPTDNKYTPQNYWRGPLWPFTNWLMAQGLHDYGFDQKVRRIENDWYKLIDQHGFCENYNPETGEPTGAYDFPVAASLFLEQTH